MNKGLPFEKIIPLLEKPHPSVDKLLLNTLDSKNHPEELLKIISCIDLTTLQGDDTPDRIEKLCYNASHPIQDSPLHTAAVCIYPVFVPKAANLLKNTDLKIATVAAGFPHGLSPLSSRVIEVGECQSLGANEIDVVICRAHALNKNWEALYQEIFVFKTASERACLKVILATGELQAPELIYKSSITAMAGGADFIKTSTGKEEVNATLEAGLIMCQAIKDYYHETGIKVGIKPAGGIKTSQQALHWWNLIGKTLGPDWQNAQLFRIGASSLLDQLVKESC